MSKYDEIINKPDKTEVEQLFIDFVNSNNNALRIKSYLEFDNKYNFVSHQIKELLNEDKNNIIDNIDKLKSILQDNIFSFAWESLEEYHELPDSGILRVLLEEEPDNYKEFLYNTGITYNEGQEFLENFSNFVFKNTNDFNKSLQIMKEFVVEMNCLQLSNTLNHEVEQLINNVLESDIYVEITHTTYDDWNSDLSAVDENFNILMNIAKLDPTDDESRIAYIMKDFGGEYDDKNNTISINSEKIANSSVFNFALQNGITLDEIINGDLNKNPMIQKLTTNLYHLDDCHRLVYFVTMSIEDSLALMMKSNANSDNEFVNIKTNSVAIISPAQGTGDYLLMDNSTTYVLPIHELKISPYLNDDEPHPYNQYGYYQYQDIFGDYLELDENTKNKLNIVKLENIAPINQRFAESVNLDSLNQKFQQVLKNSYNNDINKYSNKYSGYVRLGDKNSYFKII